jgi:hypothetical protein
MIKVSVLAAIALAAIPFLSNEAEAVPIAAEGTTDVVVSTDVLGFLVGNGITPSPVAPATASGATFMFPIIGGDLSTLVIEHSGGVRLASSAATIEVTDFIIDGGAGTVTGTVNGGASALLFTLADVDLSGPITADLVITADLNQALGDTFAGGDDPGLTGVVFGAGTTSPVPAPIPLPAGAPLLLAGLAAFAVLRRRKA